MTKKKALPESARKKSLRASPLDGASQSNDRLDDLLAALGAPGDGFEFQTKVYFVERDNSESFLFYATEEQAPRLAEYLRDGPGSGTYRVYVRRIGTGVNEIVGKLTIKVRTLASFQDAARPGPGPAPVAAASSPATDALARALENQTRLLEAIAAKLATPPPDPLAQMESFAKMVEALRPVVAPPVAASSAEARDPFDDFERGIEFAQMFGGQEREEGFIGTLKALVPLARDMMEQARHGQPVASPSSSLPGVARARPQVTGASHDAGPSSTPTPHDAAVSALVQMLKDKIQHFAIQGVDPKNAAAWVWDNVPEKFVEGFASDANAVEALETEFPELVTHHGYIVALRAELGRDIRSDAD